ncbi:hypothetical protein ACJX0J_039988 [Zea mays]
MSYLDTHVAFLLHILKQRSNRMLAVLGGLSSGLVVRERERERVSFMYNKTNIYEKLKYLTNLNGGTSTRKMINEIHICAYQTVEMGTFLLFYVLAGSGLDMRYK